MFDEIIISGEIVLLILSTYLVNIKYITLFLHEIVWWLNNVEHESK